MITENFDNYKTGGSHKEFNIEVVGTDTVIGNTNMLQESITLDEALCSDNNLKFGACEASQFSVQVANIFDDFVDKELIVSVTMDGVTTKYGTFKVDSDKPTADRVWRVLTCYDRMKDIINANVLEWYKGLTFPMSQKAYRDSFFTYLGIEQVNVSLINDDFMVQGGFTATDTLSGKTIITSICEFNGVFGHINRDGKFDYVSLDGASIVECPPYENNSVTYEDYETDYITRVTMRGTASDVGTSVGVDGNEYIITNNPIIYGTEGTDELITALTRLLNKIGSISYRPYSVGKTIGNPCVEIGDAITINTRHQTINSYVIKRTLTGIQALRDKYSATGSKVYPVEVNSVREEILRTQGKMNILTRTVDETKSQIIAIQTDLTDNYLTSTQTQTLINQSASQIQATVTQTITAELPDLVDEVTGGLSDRITVVESSYTQLSNEIVMKVKADGTVAQVALGSSAELGSNVLIKGDNIQLDGDVTITDGFRLTAGVIQSANYQEDDHGFATQGMQVTLSDGILNTPTFKIDDAGAHFIDSLYVRQKVYMDDIFYGKYRDVSIITGYVRASSDIMMETDGLIIHKNEIKILEHYHDSSSFSEHLELYGNEILFLAENYIQNKISAGAMLYIPTDNSSNDGAQADVYGDFRAFGTITSNALTASRILVSDERKRITSSSLSVSDLITTSNIGSQSVNYATSAGSATTWGGLTNDSGTLNTTDTWIPVFASGKLQHCLRAIWNSKQHTNYNTNQHYLVTLSCLSFWNGAYNSGGSSNLSYCNQGAFGTIVTKGSGDYIPVKPASGTWYTFSDNTCRFQGANSILYLAQNTRVSVVNYNNNAYVPVYASAFTVNSSKLVKENIQGISEEEALKVLNLNPVTFDYKECVGGEKDKVGLIAEEVLEVLPHLVDVPEGYDEADFDEEKGIENDILSLDYSKFVPYLIKVVQLQQKEINDLKKGYINGGIRNEKQGNY